jgi:hypothetical protein
VCERPAWIARNLGLSDNDGAEECLKKQFAEQRTAVVSQEQLWQLLQSDIEESTVQVEVADWRALSSREVPTPVFPESLILHERVWRTHAASTASTERSEGSWNRHWLKRSVFRFKDLFERYVAAHIRIAKENENT